MKQIFLDLETTGVDYTKNGIYQIGGIIRYNDVYKTFEFNCDIFEEDEIDEIAFKDTSVCPDDLKKYPDPYDTFQKLIEVLSLHVDKYDTKDKFTFINFFAGFDYDFLRQWFKSCGDKYFGSWFWHPPIGVESLAADFFKFKRKEMKNFKLVTVCEECGINITKAKTHTALYDAELAMKLYDYIQSGSPLTLKETTK